MQILTHNVPFYVGLALLFTLLVPGNTLFAATDDLTASGWIPYWRDSQGIKDAKKHLNEIDTVYPFAFTVKLDGTISDQAGLTDREWKSFIKLAQSKDVEIIPTIMWASGETIHATLSDTKARAKHVKSIADMVKKGKYDGVDIDYEAKKSETKLFFSIFLAELKAAIGDDKVLSCTLEARTPPDSLFREGEVPEVMNYANDYASLNVICDRIVLMAYDQQRADMKLNKERQGTPYMPVADVDWVEKVVELALESFPGEKIVLGIPTYGNHYSITVAPEWYRDYTRIGALNIPDILDVAKEYKVTPTRNSAGEMGYTYLHKDSKVKFAKSLKIPKDTPKGLLVAAKALAHANKTGEEVTFRMATYSDAGAMIEKIELAKKYNLRGVSFFKIDGEEDQKVWSYLKTN
jgi:spore germination protein YaaH